MTRDDLNAYFPVNFYPSDETYGQPTERWVFDVLVPYYRRMRLAMRIANWTKKWQCEDFTDTFTLAARLCHRDSPGDDFESLAIGRFDYNPESGGGHSIAAIKVRDGRIFLDPQPCLKVILTTKEENSCTLALF